MDNILIKPFDTLYSATPFELIKNEDFLPAFKWWIAATEKEIDHIVNNPEAPTYENVIAALAFAGEGLDRVSNVFFNLNSAETNDEMQAIAQEVAPLLSAHASRIAQNQDLFAKIKTVYDHRAEYTLNEEQQTLLEETYKGFVRSGALLSPEDKKKLEQINAELSVKTLQFSQNVLAATNKFYLHLTQQEDLDGIPEAIVAQYAAEAKERGLEGWVVTLQYPSYVPFMTYATNRALREKLATANGKKAFEGDEHDNQNLIKEIVALRGQKARLLGYENYAVYVLEERMAKTPQKVMSFLEELLDKATPYAQKDVAAIAELAQADGIDTVQSFDHAFYAERLRKLKYDLNDEELRPYFELEKAEQAVFSLANRLFDLSFERLEEVQTYHPDVRVFRVTENGEYKALLYMDYHPRKGKRAGAWMTAYKNQYIKDGTNSRPHISIVCNFSKATAERPALLSFQELTTLFHEFGHALHGMLANTQYPNLSGTSVKWDFVELPSQFLENYCYEPTFLQSFARHYQTSEPLPQEKIERIAESKSFMEGYQTLRQLGFGILDMKYHTFGGDIDSVSAFEKEAIRATILYPPIPNTAISPSFSHIFAGGYAAGYYSYKWAEVLDADAFQYFKDNGIFNQEIAAKYKTLLSSGGTKDPMQLYVAFRGAEPKIDSLLKRAFGL